MKHLYFNQSLVQKQQGIVLITALIFLMALTLLGLSVIGNTVIESKLALNNQERMKAFQMSESGLLTYANLVNNVEVRNKLMNEGIIDASSTYENGTPILVTQKLIDSVEIIYKGEYAQQRSSDKSQINSAVNAALDTHFEVVSTGRNAWEDVDTDGKADGVVRTFTIRNGVSINLLN